MCKEIWINANIKETSEGRILWWMCWWKKKTNWWVDEKNEKLENQNIALEMEVKTSRKIIARMKEENEKFKKGMNVAEMVIKKN